MGHNTLPVLDPAGGPRTFQRPSEPSLTSADGATHTGDARSENEDHFVVAELNRWIRIRSTSGPVRRGDAGTTQGYVLAVADGMGGHAGGEMASSVVIDCLLDHARSNMTWIRELTEAASAETRSTLAAAAIEAEARVRKVAARKGLSDAYPGTTLTAAYVVGRRLFVLHAGDSRCYLVRNGRLICLTDDHNLAEVGPDSDAAATGQHLLTNCIGGNDATVRPEVRECDLEVDDTVLLCTDGLTQHLSEEEIGELLHGGDAGVCCAKLIDAANEAGGTDNITVVIGRIGAPSEG